MTHVDVTVTVDVGLEQRIAELVAALSSNG
jgi:hypothetical protein